MITFKQGDIFTDGWDIITNTVNCCGISGRGIALEMKKRFPDNYKQYRKDCKNGLYLPGHCYPYLLDDGRVILNVTSKDHWKCKSQFLWIQSICVEVKDFLKNYEDKICHFSLWGGGNGGLNREEVKIIMAKMLDNVNCNIIVYE